MQLSVIILNYNVRYFLELCVLSVQKAVANLDAEIIVVDNDSSDDSCAMMRARFPQIKLIENKVNSGFPKGNNIGVAAAKGEYICILNPDTVVAEDTFERVLEFAKQQQNLGIVGVKLIDGTGNFLPESKRGTPTPFVAFTKVSGLYKIAPQFFGKYYANHLSEDESGKVDILVGAFMVLKRELYLEVGGFDEKCFMYSDDIDLSYTILKSGRSNFYFAGTTVIHYKGESTVKDQQYMNRFREAMDFFYKKHFRSSAIFDMFMKTGAFFFSLYKKRSTNQKKMAEHFLLLSKDESLAKRVENLLGKSVAVIGDANENAVHSFLSQYIGNSELIIDNKWIDFKTIIKLMEQLKHNNLTFKILPNQSDFIIGSNSSNDRGEVVKLHE